MYDNNNHNHNDKLIEKFAESLKKLDIPQNLRASNRNHIHNAFNALPAKTSKNSWWFKKRISIPYPVAAGFLLVFFLQFVLYSLNLVGDFKGHEGEFGNISHTSSIGQSKDIVGPYHSEQGVYVAGIGFVEKTTNTYYRMESHHENN